MRAAIPAAMVMVVDVGFHFVASHRQNSTSKMSAAIKATIMLRASTTVGSLSQRGILSEMKIFRQLAECEGRGTQVFCVLGGTVTLHVGSGTDPVVEAEPHRSFAIQPEGKLHRLAGVHLHRLQITANIRTV
jgi:hypothetical protein